MIYEEIKEKLSLHGKEYLVLSSAVSQLEQALNIVLGKPINEMIEIGTYQGLSAAVFTHFARTVFTFDVCLRNAENNWNFLGVRDKVRSFVSTREFIEYEINHYFQVEWKNRGIKSDFNFAFVDGDHTYEGIKADFELVKFCKRVLFHDYATSPYPRTFCNEIGAKQVGDLNFAYWEED